VTNQRTVSARRAVLLTIASSFMFGTSGTAQALGPNSSPIATSAARLGLGSLLLVVMLPLMGRSPRHLARYFGNRMIWLGAGCVCVFQFGYFYSAERAGVALGALVTMGSIPVITGAVGVLLGHRITVAWVLSTAVCASGLVLLGYQGVSGGNAAGVVAALVAAAGGAGFTLAVKRVIDAGAQSDLAQTALFLLAGLVMVVVALATQPVAMLATPRGLALTLWLGLMTMALPNYLWVRGLGALAPGVTATLLLGEPLTATVLGVVVLGETLSAADLGGIALVAAGLAALGLVTATDSSRTMQD
jgi:DME family drug/metabolite transporter